MSTTRKLTALFRAALDYARASIDTLAEAAGYAGGTFAQYGSAKPPSVEAARALAEVLEARGRKLLEYAGRLRAAATEREIHEQEGGTR